MDQVLDLVGLRPVSLLAEERVAEDAAPHIVIIRPSEVRSRNRFAIEPRGNVRRQVVALLRSEGIQQLRGPGDAARVIRLVPEEAQHDLAELVAHCIVIGLVHGVQERVGRLGVEIIDDGVGRVLGARAVGAIEVARRRAKVYMAHKLHLPAMPRLIRRGAFGRSEVLQLQVRGHGDRNHLLDRALRVHLRRPDGQRVRRHRHLQRLAGRYVHGNVGDDVLHAQLRVALGDVAAGESAGVVALVLNPHAHVALGQLGDGVLHLVHVAGGEIRGLAVGHIAAAGREIDDEYAAGRQPVEIAADALPHLRGVRPVPALEGLDGAILARRSLEVRRHLSRRRHRDLLPGALLLCK